MFARRVADLQSHPEPSSPALAALQRTRLYLAWARIDAQTAATELAGARQARAVELVEKLAYDLCWVERLAFVVTGDIRADQAE